MIWEILPLLGVLVGILVGISLPIQMPMEYSMYLGVALLATLDSVVGGLRASLEHKFDTTVFLSGFFTNGVVAAIIVFIGERLDIDLYMVALISFGLRIFQNIAALRRHFLKK